MSNDILTREDKIKKFEKETGLKPKPLKVRDIPVIIRYFEETGIKERVFEVLFPETEMKVSTWAEFREELNLSAEDLDAIKRRSRGDFLTALRITPGAEHLVPEVKSTSDMVKEIVDIIFDVFGDQSIYSKTIKTLAHLYDTEEENVEDLTLGQLRIATEVIVEDENFTLS